MESGGRIHSLENPLSADAKSAPLVKVTQVKRRAEMPYNFKRPVQEVTPEQQQAINKLHHPLEEIKTTAAAMYPRLCLQILRHYRDGGPVWPDKGGKKQRRNV